MQQMALPIAELVLPTVALLIPLYLYIRFRRSENTSLPMDWPILGVLPSIAANRHSFHDFVTSVLAATNLNFRAYDPPGTNMRFFLTCDPENVRHILTKNFANYPKGDDFSSMFGDLLEGTIFTTDGESWRQQRTRIHHVLTRPSLLDSMSRGCRDKVARGLVPLMSSMATTGAPFDMDDMLGRLVFDTTVMLIFGEDPHCLSAGKPAMPITAAMDALMQVAFFRHTVPTACWKLMRRLRIGPERNAASAEAVLWDFVAEKIRRRIAGRRRADGEAAVVHVDDILSHYIDDPDYFDGTSLEPTDFLLRTFINFMVALRDPVGAALPWLLYNLATHPRVVAAVREELAPIVASRRRTSSPAGDDGGAVVVFEPEELKDLVYIRAVLFESLRLYPSGPIERKTVLADDMLPSGHAVRAGENVLMPVYSMGRMESVWGEDCREYRPERWLSESENGTSRMRFVPSYKFVSFNSGPRSCLGKNIAVAQMVTVAAAVAWNFDVEVMEGHVVKPKLSVVLQMKNGLMVKVKKRAE